MYYKDYLLTYSFLVNKGDEQFENFLQKITNFPLTFPFCTQVFLKPLYKLFLYTYPKYNMALKICKIGETI